MARGIFRPSGKLFLTILSALGIACFSASAFAATAPNVAAGCNANVWNALTAKAEAQVAYDAAITRQLINKPDSVLTLTCFDQAASVSATAGGAIFSGPFATQLSTAMPVAGIAPDTGTLGVYNCTEIGTLWNTIATEGINIGTPYATFNDLLTGTLPTPSPNTPAIPTTSEFAAGWTAANTAQVFSNLQTAITNLPPQPAPLDFSSATSSCQVLVIAGITPGPCPVAGSFSQ